MIKRLLAEVAAQEQAPSDWCYVNNCRPSQTNRFRVARWKRAIGTKSLSKLWRSVSRMVQASFQHETYIGRIEMLKNSLNQAQQTALQELAQEGEKRQLKLVLRPQGGHGFVPTATDGEIMTSEAFDALPTSEQHTLKSAIQEMEAFATPC